MKKKKLYQLLAALMLASMILAACGAAQPAPAYPDWAISTCNTGRANVTIDEKTVDCGEVLNGAEPNNVAVPAGGASSSNSGDSMSTDGGSAGTCEDGKNTTPLFFEKPTDVPWGTKEGTTVAEIAWKPGSGFGGWNRIIAIAERIVGTEMPYANSILTLHVTQHCGSLDTIKAYAPNYVTAMINSGQNGTGQRPSVDEIPIVLLKRDGSIEWVKQASNGPSMSEIQAHLEMRP